MADPQTPPPPADRPYHEINGCAGRYMEPGTDWEKTQGLCSSTCPVRYQCWALKNNIVLETGKKA